MNQWLIWVYRIIIPLFLLPAMNCSSSKLVEGPSPKDDHEALYKKELQSYANILVPGMTRKNVEEYLGSKKILYKQMCCIEEKDAFADLVKVGEESHPWYCGEGIVYIAFQFKATEPRRPLILEAESDVLTKVDLYHSLEDCL
jgi:hypothetical protein